MEDTSYDVSEAARELNAQKQTWNPFATATEAARTLAEAKNSRATSRTPRQVSSRSRRAPTSKARKGATAKKRTSRAAATRKGARMTTKRKARKMPKRRAARSGVRSTARTMRSRSSAKRSKAGRTMRKTKR